jgi:tRNA A-37 threonylcarbamoyl transferase component Bud32
MKDKYAGLNFEETSLVMKVIGNFHALTYFLIRWEGEKLFETQLKELKGMDSSMFEEGMSMFQCVLRNAIEIIEKRDPELGAKMKPLEDTKDIKVMFETGFKTDSVYFPVIVHGDLWMNNILFKYDSAGVPIDLKLIDLQLTRRGNIFEDLQYFIFTSTTPALRKKHLSEFLNTYYDSFMGTIEELKSPAPLNFTRGFFIDSFRSCYLPTLRYLTFAIPLQLGTPISEIKKMAPPPPPSQENGNAGNAEAGASEAPADPMAMMKMGLRLQLETSPRAVERLESIVREMADFKII